MAKPQSPKGKRFRVAKGEMLVTNPQNQSERLPVHLLVDQHNRALGAQVLEGRLKGYVVWVAEKSFELTKKKGVEVDALKR